MPCSRCRRGFAGRAAAERARAGSSYSTSRASVDLPDPDTPVTTVSRPSGTRDVDLAQVVQRRALDHERRRLRRVPRAAARADAQRVARGSGPVTDSGAAISRRARAGADDVAAARARAGAEVDHVIGAPDRVLVVLDDQQRVALRARAASSVSSSIALSRGCRPIVGSSST